MRRNLQSIVEYAEASAPASLEDHDGTSPPGLCRRLAEHLPLSHATGQATFTNILVHDGLFSWNQLTDRGWVPARAGSEPSVEARLGTDDSVFTYAAPFRYPATSCGLLFKTSLELRRSDQATATPFDSGATPRFLRPEDSVEEQVAFVRSHEMPVPEYRQALEKILAQCFASPWDYVDGTDPVQWPVPVTGGDWRRWTFEVRFRDQVRLAGSLLAVFLPRSCASEFHVLQRIARWRRAGIAIEIFETPKDEEWQALQSLSTAFLRKSLM